MEAGPHIRPAAPVLDSPPDVAAVPDPDTAAARDKLHRPAVADILPAGVADDRSYLVAAAGHIPVVEEPGRSLVVVGSPGTVGRRIPAVGRHSRLKVDRRIVDRHRVAADHRRRDLSSRLLRRRRDRWRRGGV